MIQIHKITFGPKTTLIDQNPLFLEVTLQSCTHHSKNLTCFSCENDHNIKVTVIITGDDEMLWRLSSLDGFESFISLVAHLILDFNAINKWAAVIQIRHVNVEFIIPCFSGFIILNALNRWLRAEWSLQFTVPQSLEYDSTIGKVTLKELWIEFIFI